VRENEGESDSGAEASDDDDETGELPITAENFEISADRVSGTITIRPRE
jgi:hypothetical protein